VWGIPQRYKWQCHQDATGIVYFVGWRLGCVRLTMADEPEPSPLPPKPHPIRRFFRQTGPAGPMAVIVSILPAVGTAVLFSVAKPTSAWLAAHRPGSIVLFILAVAILNGLALMTTYANSLLAGWTFKFTVGFPAMMIGLASAAMIGYALAGAIVGHRVENAIAEHPKWEIVRTALIGRSTLRTIAIITLLRLSPLLPFETTNALLAMCGVRPLPYLIGTVLGIAPRTAAVVFFASSMHELTLQNAPDPMTIIVGVVVTIVGIVVLGIVAKHALNRACAAK
jgi:uncharacterized membrane protein YdjX (TVP38/TMEM64 family)